MARKTKAPIKANPDSPFWHPKKAGDGIKGLLNGFTKTLIGPVMQLQVNGKDIPVGIGANLKSTLAPYVAGMKKGDTVEVKFLGDKKTAKGRTVKTYDVFHKGKKLENVNIKAAIGEAVAEMFK